MTRQGRGKNMPPWHRRRHFLDPQGSPLHMSHLISTLHDLKSLSLHNLDHWLKLRTSNTLNKITTNMKFTVNDVFERQASVQRPFYRISPLLQCMKGNRCHWKWRWKVNILVLWTIQGQHQNEVQVHKGEFEGHGGVQCMWNHLEPLSYYMREKISVRKWRRKVHTTSSRCPKGRTMVVFGVFRCFCYKDCWAFW